MRKKRTHRRGVIILIILAAALGALAYVLVKEMESRNTAPVPAVVLGRGLIEYSVEADGMIEAENETEIYAPNNLKVLEIYAHEGDKVLAGDMLAQLDVETLELEIRRAELNIRSAEANMSSEQVSLANSVTGAKNSLSLAEVSLQTAQREYDALLEKQGNEASVKLAEINLDLAKRSWENSKSLYEQGAVPKEALTQAQEALDKAQSSYDDAVRTSTESLDRAKETLDAALVRYKTAEDSLDDAVSKNTDPAAAALELQRVALKEKQLRLRDAAIASPVDGTVTLVNAKEGASASGLMFVIIDHGDKLIVRTRVEEADIGSIYIGMPCRVRPTGWEDTLDGIVSALPTSAERDSAGGFKAVIGDDAYFAVEVTIEKPPQETLIGMNAKVTFIAAAHNNCFSVPNGLVYRDGQKHWVLVMGENGELTEMPVETGIENRRMVEIISDSLYEGMELYTK